MSLDIAAMLDRVADAHPEAEALVFARGEAWEGWTFGQLRQRAHRYAVAFESAGLRRGDRVLMLARPSHDFYGVLFGLLAIGGVPVLVDPGMGLKNVLACIQEAAPRALIGIPPVHLIRLFARRSFATVEIPITVGRRWLWGGHTLAGLLASIPPDARYAPAGARPEEEAAIVFTSGSTGRPKGVSFRHGMFSATTRILAEAFELGPGRTTVETFAAFVLIDMALGMRAIIPHMDMSRPARADPEEILRAFTSQEADAGFASPVVLRKLVEAARRQGVQLPALRTLLSGVAPVPGQLHADLREIAPAVDLRVNYGATECLTVAAIGTEDVLDETWQAARQGQGSCVGRPLPGMQVAIAPITEQALGTWAPERELARGEIGEILVQGPVVSPEYKERPQANRMAKIPDEEGGLWHRTGDLGWRDASGRLWFCGRKKHRVLSHDGMIPAVPVEGVFADHQAVARCALVGVGEPGAELPVLAVELAPGHRWSEELAAELLARAAGTRWEGVVARALPCPDFPVDARHNAKIRRGELKRRIESTWSSR